MKQELEDIIKQLIIELGYDPEGPNFKGTPDRVARMWTTFRQTEGIKFTSFPLQGGSQSGGMICVDGHEAWSFCPHHLLPVKYKIKVGYIPNKGQVLGLSKLARICNSCMTIMPLQEDLAYLIAEPIIKAIKPQGVGVMIKGKHLCMRMRGVESPCAVAKSTYMWGVFREDQKARAEFMLL